MKVVPCQAFKGLLEFEIAFGEDLRIVDEISTYTVEPILKNHLIGHKMSSLKIGGLR